MSSRPFKSFFKEVTGADFNPYSYEMIGREVVEVDQQGKQRMVRFAAEVEGKGDAEG